MQLSPQYDQPLVVTFEGKVDDQREPVVRQRRRLQDALATLTDGQWRTPSRCDGWTVQDVIAHLIGTNQFWTMSILAGLAGEPTRFLATFDPVKTPAAMVTSMRSMSPAETFEQFAETNASLFDAVAALTEDDWSKLAESPAGHVPIRIVAHHALWDAWIHERDVLLPLGLKQDEEIDEITSCLRYAAVIAPVLGFASNPSRTGALAIDATEPDVRVVVEVDTTIAVHGGDVPSGAVRLTGRAVDVVDMLTIRAPLDQPVPEDGRWLFEGLATVFDTTVAHA